MKKITKELPRVDHCLKSIRNADFPALNKPIKELAFGQVINDKLASVAHALVDLRIAQVTNDSNKARHITSTLLRDPHASMKRLLDEVRAFDAQVSVFYDSYNHLLEEKIKELPLEDSLGMIEKLSEPRKLVAISQKQKQCMQILGKHFVELARATAASTTTQDR